MKVCSKCNQLKHEVEYHKNKDHKDGLAYYCKSCQVVYNRQYRLDNAEKVKVRKKQYRLDNAEKIKAHKKQYRLDNAEKIKAHKKQYSLDNAEKIKEKKRQFYVQKTAEKRTVMERQKEEKKKQHQIQLEAKAEKKKQDKVKKAEEIEKHKRQRAEEMEKHKKQYEKEIRATRLQRHNESNRAWRAANIEKDKEQKNRWAENNKWYKTQWYEENKELTKKRFNARAYSPALFDAYADKIGIYEEIEKSQDGFLKVKCVYCGGWTIATNLQVMNRIVACEKLDVKQGTENRIYCSQQCKEACPIYQQILYPKGFKQSTSREVNTLVRQMCFERDSWQCQRCSQTIPEVQLHCHHINGVAESPIEANDIDNVITLCKQCHKDVHKQKGCTRQDYQRNNC